MTSQYERELRHVLAGIPSGVEAVIRSCSVEEKERMRLVLNRPFLVVELLVQESKAVAICSL